MGVELVKVVSARHGNLPGNAYKVLVRMALMALDRPSAEGRPAALYFGGWEPLALAMGWNVPERSDDPATVRRRRKLKNYVTAALEVLAEEHRLIEKLEKKARMGTRQVYRLTLAPAAGTQKVGPTWDPESGSQWTPESGSQVGPKNWDGWDPESGAPRKDQGGTEDLLQDSTTSSPLSPHGDAREDAADGMPDRAADTDARFLAAQAARQSIATARQAAQR